MLKEELCKIGELAEMAGVPRSTIHYYCKINLLEPADYSPAGYRLFAPEESIERIQEIREFVESKATLKDLKRKIKSN